ncbi:MAG: tryptophan synthase subunit alpha [Gammaproteobacteria bacterium]|jgi:tryptophan synthase alpha chain|nr:tryptophan synthase subunit alpha [Gammaproteobacteria bacterium]
MSRIKQCFSDLKSQRKKALIPFITAGDPQPGVTVGLMHAMVTAGADLLELGVPFSDPMADGPVIQAACERALRHHVTLHNVLDMVRDFRRDDIKTPVILMGYLNPIEAWGYAAFAQAAAAAGVDGVLTVDMPPEEAGEFTAAMNAAAIDTIFLLAPTSDDSRMQRVSEVASGFIYYVSFKGVTGANRLDVSSVATKLSELRHYTKLPVGVGFGIRDAETAGQVAGIADAVVVGSALVQQIAELAERPEVIPAALAVTIAELRAGIDKAV